MRLRSERMLRRAALVLLLAAPLGACGPSKKDLAPPNYEDDPAARSAMLASALEGHRAAFVLTWNGQRIGEARETFVAEESALGGYRFERSERVMVRRGDAISVARTVITVDVDPAMVARKVVVARENGSVQARSEAVRMSDNGWRISADGVEARLVDGAAVPATLVPLLVAAGRGQGVVYDGPVLVEGAGLARARLRVEIVGREAHARYQTAAGELRASARLTEDGQVEEAGLGAQLGSRRATETELAEAFDPPEIVDASAIKLMGATRLDDVRILVSGVRVPPPALPEIPEQTIVSGPNGVLEIRVTPAAWPQAGDGAWREVRERTEWVSSTLTDDLRVTALSASEAIAAGRGDCTAHAVVLDAELRARGYETRLVTGFVIESGALNRHRWVAVRIGKRWIPVDPMFDEVPAQPTHIALAVHGASPDELAFIDDVVFAGWTEASASWAP
jgi:hypothetical protein